MALIYGSAQLDDLRALLADTAELYGQPVQHVEQLLVDSNWQTAEGLKYTPDAFMGVCRIAGGLHTLVNVLRESSQLSDGAALAARVFNLVISASYSAFRGKRLLVDTAKRQICACVLRAPRAYPFDANLERILAVPGWEYRCATYEERTLTVWLRALRSPVYQVVDLRGRRRRYVGGRILRVSDSGRYYTRGAAAILRARDDTYGFASYGLERLVSENPAKCTAETFLNAAIATLKAKEDLPTRRVETTLRRLAAVPLFSGVATPPQYAKRAQRLAHQLRYALPGKLVQELLERSLLRQIDAAAPAYLRRLPITSAAQWPAVSGARRLDLLHAMLCTQDVPCHEVYRWRLAYAANALLRGANQVLFSGRNNRNG